MIKATLVNLHGMEKECEFSTLPRIGENVKFNYRFMKVWKVEFDLDSNKIFVFVQFID